MAEAMIYKIIKTMYDETVKNKYIKGETGHNESDHDETNHDQSDEEESHYYYDKSEYYNKKTDQGNDDQSDYDRRTDKNDPSYDVMYDPSLGKTLLWYNVVIYVGDDEETLNCKFNGYDIPVPPKYFSKVDIPTINEESLIDTIGKSVETNTVSRDKLYYLIGCFDDKERPYILFFITEKFYGRSYDYERSIKKLRYYRDECYKVHYNDNRCTIYSGNY